MKYIPLNNQPNVSETREQSISPSLRMDDRDYPCIAYLSKGFNINQVNYSFWDGLKWSFYGIPKVYVSQSDIIFSPNALWLDTENNPSICFSRKIGSGYRLSVATYTDAWVFNDLDVDYEVTWIGITGLKAQYNNSSSSSSESVSTSSSSSMSEVDYFIVSYDSTNSMFHVYSVSGSLWTLLGSKYGLLDNFDGVRIDICGRKIGIAYVYNSFSTTSSSSESSSTSSSSIKYNFIDIDTFLWSFVNFNDVIASQLYGEIIDMDLRGYYTGSSVMAFSWLSKTDDTFYINGVLCYDTGIETPLDGISPVIESNAIDVVSSYIVNGYRKVGICLDSLNLPWIIATGMASKMYNFNGMVWSKDLIDIEGISNGIVPNYMRIDYGDNVKMSLATDSGDIYYFESSSGSYAESNPDMILLNNKWAYHAEYSSGKLNGVDIEGTYENIYGDILRDSERPVMITSNLSTPVTTTTTTLP